MAPALFLLPNQGAAGVPGQVGQEPRSLVAAGGGTRSSGPRLDRWVGVRGQRVGVRGQRAWAGALPGVRAQLRPTEPGVHSLQGPLTL